VKGRWVHRSRRAGYRSLLEVFRRLPVSLRRSVVRFVGPSYTVGALAVVKDGNRVLLLRPSYRKGWGLPGGMLQRGESPATAAVREAAEELGIQVEVCGPGTLVLDAGPRRIDFVYPAQPVGERMRPRKASVEVSEWGWFGMDALPDLLPEARSALDALERRADGPVVLSADTPSEWLV
jgi:ADP-ribose pyrophosphatase YjhB (NUDIX family)